LGLLSSLSVADASYLMPFLTLSQTRILPLIFTLILVLILVLRQIDQRYQLGSVKKMSNSVEAK